jgi:hypothetical protein
MTVGSYRLVLAAAMTLATLVAAPPAAEAQRLDDAAEMLLDKRARSLAATIARRALTRGRRAFALGPLAGAAGAITTDGDPDFQVSGGLALMRYGIEIFITRDRVVEMLKSRAQEILLERLASGEAPSPEDLERLIGQVVEDVKAELLMELEPSRFERPKLKLAVEAGHLFDADGWEVRGTLGIGVSRVFVATGLVGQFADGAALVIPIELSVPMLLSGSLRSPAVDWFARYDVTVNDRDTRPDRVVVGARFILDII